MGGGNCFSVARRGFLRNAALLPGRSLGRLLLRPQLGLRRQLGFVVRLNLAAQCHSAVLTSGSSLYEKPAPCPGEVPQALRLGMNLASAVRADRPQVHHAHTLSPSFEHAFRFPRTLYCFAVAVSVLFQYECRRSGSLRPLGAQAFFGHLQYKIGSLPRTPPLLFDRVLKAAPRTMRLTWFCFDPSLLLRGFSMSSSMAGRLFSRAAFGENAPATSLGPRSAFYPGEHSASTRPFAGQLRPQVAAFAFGSGNAFVFCEPPGLLRCLAIPTSLFCEQAFHDGPASARTGLCFVGLRLRTTATRDSQEDQGHGKHSASPVDLPLSGQLPHRSTASIPGTDPSRPNRFIDRQGDAFSLLSGQ